MDMWTRKIIAASLTAPVYAFVLACGVVVWEQAGAGIFDTLNGVLLLTAAYLTVSFPVLVTYGVVTSMLSDALSRRAPDRFSAYVTFGLHIGFGLVMLWLGAGAAVLFWIIDRQLQRKRRRIGSKQALTSFAVPVGVVLSAVGIVYVIDVVEDVVRRFYG